MTTLQEAVSAVKGMLGAKEDRIQWQIGYLGDGAGNVYTSRENWLLVRYPFSNSPAVPVYSVANIPVVDGLRVKVGYLPWEPGVFQVISFSDQRIDGLGSTTSDATESPVVPGSSNGYAAIGPHWVNHMYLGIDSGFINWRQITPLGVFPTNPASLSVRIQEGYIPRPGTDLFINTQTVDLTSHVPVSGARYVLISYDSSGSVVATDGSINAGGFYALTAADIPDTPAGNWRSCAVVMYPSQTAIREDTGEIDFYDLRFPEESIAGSITPDQIVLTDSHIIVGNSSNVATDVAMSGDATMANTGALTIANNAVTYAKIQDVTATQRVIGRNTAGSGDPEEVTTSQLIDWLGSTRGAIIYRGASGWAILAPGTSGDVLTSNGAGADPSYQTTFPGALSAYNEVQTADGTSTIYYLANYAAPSTIRVWVDGIRQQAGDDTDPTDTVTFSVAPLAGAQLIFDYEMDQA